MLYFPWREELQDLQYNESYESKFTQGDVQNVLQINMKKHIKCEKQVDEAIEDMEEHGIPDNTWDQIAGQTQQENDEDVCEGTNPDPQFAQIIPSKKQINSDANLGQPGKVPHEYKHDREQMSTSDWLEMVISLNEKQYFLHQYIVEWCWNKKLNDNYTPFHIFLTGGGGGGEKSSCTYSSSNKPKVIALSGSTTK